MKKLVPFQVGDLVKIKSSEDESIGNLYPGKMGVIVAIKKDNDPDGTIDVKFGPSLDLYFGVGGSDGREFRKKGRIVRFAEGDLCHEDNSQSELSIEDYTSLLFHLDSRYTTPAKECMCQYHNCPEYGEIIIWINHHGDQRKVAVCKIHAKEFNGAWTEVFEI